MADLQQLERALINADKAGDADAARVFAAEIRKLRSAPQAAPQEPKQEPGMLDSAIQWAKDDIAAIPKRVGNLAAGAVRGAGSIGATILAPVDVAARAVGIQNDFIGRTDRRAAMDGGLRELGADTNSAQFQVGKLGAEIAGTAGVGGVLGAGARAAGAAPSVVNALTTSGMRAGANPGAVNMLTRMGGGAATGAATAGMINPEDASTGALIGGALPPALSGFAKAGTAIGQKLAVGGANRELAQKAVNQYGIPLGVADIAENGTVKGLRSMLNDAPFAGGVGAAQRESVQEGFNRAVGGTFGAPEKKLTADVVDAAKKRMGAEFDRIWNNNTLQVDGGLVNQMIALQKQAAKLPKNEGASLAAEINDLFAKMVPDQNGGVVIPGDVANKFQSYLRRRAEGSAGLKNELGDLRQWIISAFNRGIRPEDAAALTLNRSQYKAFKTVEPLLNSAEAGVAGRAAGDIPAALLPNAVARQYSQVAGTELGDLAQIGSRFIVDRTPKTGGSARAALQNSLLVGAGVGGLMTNPLLAASTIPAAAGTNALLGSSALAKRLLNSGQGNRLAQLMAAPENAQLLYRTAPAISAQ